MSFILQRKSTIPVTPFSGFYAIYSTYIPRLGDQLLKTQSRIGQTTDIKCNFMSYWIHDCYRLNNNELQTSIQIYLTLQKWPFLFGPPTESVNKWSSSILCLVILISHLFEIPMNYILGKPTVFLLTTQHYIMNHVHRKDKTEIPS